MKKMASQLVGMKRMVKGHLYVLVLSSLGFSEPICP